MTGKYASDHAGALADIAEAGAAVTFSSSTAGSYDAATDTTTGGATATVTGHAIEVRGDPKLYERLNLVEAEAPTLLFAPSTYGGLPPLNASVPWAGATYEVRSVLPVRPDGTAIIARVVVAR